MCGECIEGYGLPVYSYNLSCVECSNYKYNWLKYIAVAYIPLTIFYFIVIKFRISATSGLLAGYVTICHMITIKGFSQWAMLNAEASNMGAELFVKFVITTVSVWNLDFFRAIYPTFCLHPQLSSLQALMLEYAVAIYPLVLVMLTYLLVKLHDRFGLVVRLCRPFYRSFHNFRKNWDVRSSLVLGFCYFLSALLCKNN